MRDFLPEDVRRREFVIGIITRVYERYGFEPLETPAVENLETLMGSTAKRATSSFSRSCKRETRSRSRSGRRGRSRAALRPDRSAGTRHRASPEQAPRLFSGNQIQPVWRADRPARGRFREFFQCDVDALGSTSPVIEAEICAAVSDAAVGSRLR
jgi:histidyl-tRNA synthetase